jgi:hypothetical protein
LGGKTMPLVYVHGVANRRGETAEEQQVFDNRVMLIAEQFRHTVFAERVSAADGLRVFTPYWGDLGVKFARNLACLPQSGIQALSVGSPREAPLLEATARIIDADVLRQQGVETAPLLTLARTRTLGAAVDLLFAGVATAPLPGILFDEAAIKEAMPEVAQFAEVAERYSATQLQPEWLKSVADDDEFLNRLIQEVTTFKDANAPATSTSVSAEIQALGLRDELKSFFGNAAKGVRRAVEAVTGVAADVATKGAREGFMAVSGHVRPAASAFIGRFFGDVFTYMENRQPIIDLVLADIDKAVAAKRDGDVELYLVGHSFGGIILYDILTSFRPKLECALYVTVGSQVGLFAEIGRLADKGNIDAAFKVNAKSLVPRPDALERWVNIFDSTDFLGFGTKGVFSGVKDFRFETDALPLVSHSAYFDTPRFFAKLRKRVREAFQSGTD